MIYHTIYYAPFFLGFAALAGMWFLFCAMAHLFVKSHFDRSCFMDGYRAGRAAFDEEPVLAKRTMAKPGSGLEDNKPVTVENFEPVNGC